MEGAFYLTGIGRRWAASALMAVALCAGTAGAQFVSIGGPPATPGPVGPARHRVAPAGAEVDVALPHFVIPDTGICVDPSLNKKKEFHTVRIDHRPTDIPVYAPEPGSRRAPAWDDTSNDWTRSQPLFQDFDSMGPNGLTPPDPDLATDGTYILAVTNDDFAVYDTCGTQLYRIDVEDYLGYASDFLLYDPKVIYDPWNARWVMMWHKKRATTQESSMIMMFTGGSTPFGLSGAGAYWYDVNMVQNDGSADESWADYYDLGYSSNAITFAGNQFRWDDSFRWSRIRFVDKTVSDR